MLRLFFIPVFIIVATSCQPDDCLHSTGSTTTLTKTTEGFSAIQVTDVFDIQLRSKSDTSYRVHFTGGKNQLKNVEANVVNGKLILRNHNRCSFLRSYNQIKVLIESPSLSEIRLEAGARISSYDTLNYPELLIVVNGGIGECDLKLNCQTVWLSLNGATGNYKLQGNCSNAFFYLDGYGSLNAKNFHCNFLEISSKTTADSWIYAVDTIRAFLSSKGNIYYSGNPSIVEVLEKKSTGELIHNMN
jgi:hypothetical protein